MDKGVSIIVCCFNSEERLPVTIEHLARQNLPEEFKWEVIVVNNNSEDNTEQIALSEFKKHDLLSISKIIDEKTPGLSNARMKGIENAKFEYLLFCDDDNWLSESYVYDAFNIMESDDSIAALGGWCEASTDTDLPVWFDKFEGNFAVGKPAINSGFINEATSYLYGAGLIVRKNALEKLFSSGFKNVLSDRKGKKLSSGGDVELIYALKLLGLRIYFDDRLYFKHYMPAARLNFEYLKKIRKSNYYSNFILGMYRDQFNGVTNQFNYLFKRYIRSIYQALKLYIIDYHMAVKYDKLFVLNQLYVILYFLIYPIKYFKIRKQLAALQES
jgi:glycosyltransferase involved in cell wall biosynthesis